MRTQKTQSSRRKLPGARSPRIVRLALVLALLLLPGCDDGGSNEQPMDADQADDSEDLVTDTPESDADMPDSDAADMPIDIQLDFTPEEAARLEAFCGPEWEAVEEDVARALATLSMRQKVNLMSGENALPMGGLWYTPPARDTSFNGYRMTDGPRGVGRLVGPATAFPVGMARGASWNPELERQIGAAMARETHAYGANVLLAPCVNVLRHPRWGRAQETYGEDPMHIGEMGVAYTNGVQGEGIVASVKHFAVNSIENTRFQVNVDLDERTLREIYLPHFERIVKEAHVGSVMSAYNSVNGNFCSENTHLLRDILKGEWGFLGFVESDWIEGTKSTVDAALAGLDIEMPLGIFFGDDLLAAVERGDVPENVIDEAVRRILRVQGCFDRRAPEQPDMSIIESEEHLSLARQSAVESTVLLKNENVLPLNADQLQNVAVVGALADVANIGDGGSSAVAPSEVITPLAGITAALPDKNVLHIGTNTPSLEEDADISNANAVIVVVGLTEEDEGEGAIAAGDRAMLGLQEEQVTLIEHVATLNQNAVVVVEGGSAVAMPWLDSAPAVVMAWYPGSQGGHALADLLLGAENFSGRLPIVFPASEADTVEFDNESLDVYYDYLHGYRFIDDKGAEPLFPFGFGGSYTSYGLSNLQLSADRLSDGDSLTVTVDVANTGDRAGVETVQLYLSWPDSLLERGPVNLRAFEQISLQPGESGQVILQLSSRDFAHFEEGEGWLLEPGDVEVKVGHHSRDLPLVATVIVE